MSPLFAFQIFGSIALIALVLGTIWIPAWRRRRAEAPLRAELRARRADYSVTVMTRPPLSGANLPLRDHLSLTVRGDAFEISHPNLGARLIFGQEHCFRAAATTIATARSQMQDWIVVQGLPASRHNRVWITRRGQLAAIWEALIRAGAQPASPPPL
jgi:hypothetical protein